MFLCYLSSFCYTSLPSLILCYTSILYDSSSIPVCTTRFVASSCIHAVYQVRFTFVVHQGVPISVDHTAILHPDILKIVG